MVQHPMPEPPPDREGWDNRSLELLLAFTLPRDGTYLDVGANEGRFLWHSLRHAPEGRHVAWEPLPHLAAHLRRTFPGVEVQEVALSDRAGESDYVVVDDDSGYSGMRERPYPQDFRRHRITVRTERLDDVFDGRIDVAEDRRRGRRGLGSARRGRDATARAADRRPGAQRQRVGRLRHVTG